MISTDLRGNSAVVKRAEQLKRWEESDTNQQPASPKPEHGSRIKFSPGCVFLAACLANDKEEVVKLLDKGADINTATVDGLTALHQACIDDNLEMVEFLVEHGADVNHQDNEGWTPLHATVSCGFVSIARFLVEHGADMAAVNSDGDLAVDLAVDIQHMPMIEYMQKIVAEQQIDCVQARQAEEQIMLNDAKQWLRGDAAEINTPQPKTGATALHIAAAKGYKKVMTLLLAGRANVDAQDNDGWTALHAAAHWGQKETAEMLVDAMADMDLRNFAGQTCVDVADRKIVKFLEELKVNSKRTKRRPSSQMRVNDTIEAHLEKTPAKIIRVEIASEKKITSASSSQRSNAIDGHNSYMSVPIENSESAETDSEITDSTESPHTTSVSASDEDEPNVIKKTAMIPETISPSQQHQQSPSVLTEDILKTRRHNTLANALSSGDIQLKNQVPEKATIKPVAVTATAASPELPDIYLHRGNCFGHDIKLYKKFVELSARLQANDANLNKFKNSRNKAAELRNITPTHTINNDSDSKLSSEGLDPQKSDILQTTNLLEKWPNTDPYRTSCVMESASEPRVSRYGINGNRGYLNIKRSISRLPSPVAERILHSENFSLKLDHERNSSPHSEDKSSLLRERCCKLRKLNMFGSSENATTSTLSDDSVKALAVTATASSTTSTKTVTTSTTTTTSNLASNSLISPAITKIAPIRRSFVPPARDEESETQRKAHAKRVRETRRSTQGVTLDEIKSAEELVKKKTSNAICANIVTSTNSSIDSTNCDSSGGNNELQTGTGITQITGLPTVAVPLNSLEQPEVNTEVAARLQQQQEITLMSPNSLSRMRISGGGVLNSGQKACLEEQDHSVINDTVMLIPQKNFSTSTSTRLPTSMITATTPSIPETHATKSKVSSPIEEIARGRVYESFEDRIIAPLTRSELSLCAALNSNSNKHYKDNEGVMQIHDNGIKIEKDDNSAEKNAIFEDITYITEKKLKENTSDDPEQVMREKTEQLLKMNHEKLMATSSITPRTNERIRNNFLSLQTFAPTLQANDVIGTNPFNSGNKSSTVRLREKRPIFNDNEMKLNDKIEIPETSSLNATNFSESQSAIIRHNDTKPNSLANMNLISGVRYNYTTSRRSLDSSPSVPLINSSIQLRNRDTSGLIDTRVSSSLSCNSMTTSASKISAERRPSWRLKFDSVSKFKLEDANSATSSHTPSNSTIITTAPAVIAAANSARRTLTNNIADGIQLSSEGYARPLSAPPSTSNGNSSNTDINATSTVCSSRLFETNSKQNDSNSNSNSSFNSRASGSSIATNNTYILSTASSALHENAEDKENENRSSLATQAVIQRRRKPKRRSTGVVHIDVDDLDTERTDGTSEADEKESGSEQRHTSRSRLNSTANQTSSTNEARCRDRSAAAEQIDYKALWEACKLENEKLKQQLKKKDDEILQTRTTIERFTNTAPKNTLSEIEKRERRTMERKLSEMEEELKQLEVYKTENLRLKEENGALIRVISKLSK